MGFRMPTDSLRMARIHPGHNGPPPSSNVIPEPVQNRVKKKKVEKNLKSLSSRELWEFEN